MTYRLAISHISLWVVAAGLLPGADESSRRPGIVSSTQRASFAPGGTIRFDNSFGDLFVEGWDQPQVEMTLEKSVLNPYAPPKDAAQRLERVRFTMERPSENELVIGTAIPSHRFLRHPFGGKGDVTVSYTLRVPRDSRLIVHHGGGNILIGQVTADLEVTNREGDIVLMLPSPGPYAIDARSKMGTVISDFAGQTRVRYFVGERFAGADGDAPRRIFLRVGFGGITIKEVPPEALLRP
jgi:hypothetical protein